MRITTSFDERAVLPAVAVGASVQIFTVVTLFWVLSYSISYEYN